MTRGRKPIVTALAVVVLGGVELSAEDARAQSQDAPEISRSRGTPGGVLVFWPRVIPRTETAASRPFAAMVQKRLTALVRETLPQLSVDIRPEPERVCPRVGCAAMTVGALLARDRFGCVVVALVSRPGQAPATLVPWVGTVDLETNVVAFREPPESSVTIRDWAECAALETDLQSKKQELVAAIAAAAR
jgi:hypothetical protein